MDFSQRLVAARDGDDEALRALFLGAYPALRAEVARSLPIDLERVVAPEDILQEVFLEATLRLKDFDDRGEAAFHGWLRTIATHRTINAVAAQHTLKRGGGAAHLPLPDVAGRGPGGGSLAALADHQSLVMRLLHSMKTGPRELLRLRFAHGLSPAQIATTIGKTPEAVGMATLRALETLRDKLRSSDRGARDDGNSAPNR
ncbi:hypothetical protein AY599_02550 [Leptolyngbya valderiana BDU 20041]|nr:hypothetical protein AY599_02550 [Leptolyngbya valderiana BDU 20041]